MNDFSSFAKRSVNSGCWPALLKYRQAPFGNTVQVQTADVTRNSGVLAGAVPGWRRFPAVFYFPSSLTKGIQKMFRMIGTGRGGGCWCEGCVGEARRSGRKAARGSAQGSDHAARPRRAPGSLPWHCILSTRRSAFVAQGPGSVPVSASRTAAPRSGGAGWLDRIGPE